MVPEISVVVTLEDHRGGARACLESLQRQSCPPQRFEVLAVSNGDDAGMERAARECLGANGRLVSGPGRGEMDLYHLGALEARAPVLLFTESHCVFEPDCVQALLAHLLARPAKVTRLRSLSRYHGVLGRMEGLMFEWCRQRRAECGLIPVVPLRGFAVRRATYFECGGFKGRYGLFAEHALSGSFAQRGLRIEVAEAAAVHHQNAETFAELGASIADFTRGEIRYRLEHDALACARPFGLLAIFHERERFRRANALALCQAAWRLLAASPARSGQGAIWRTWMRSLSEALLGLRVEGWLARWKVACAKVRFAFSIGEGARLRAYADVWEAMAHALRVEALREVLRERPQLNAGRQIHPARHSDDACLVGFHAPESAGNAVMRWSRSVALIQFHAPACDGEIFLNTGAFARPKHLRFFLNGRRVRGRQIARGPNGLSIRCRAAELGAGGTQRLAWACTPLPSHTWPKPDAREFGLPLFAFAWIPQAIEPSAAREASRPMAVAERQATRTCAGGSAKASRPALA